MTRIDSEKNNINADIKTDSKSKLLIFEIDYFCKIEKVLAQQSVSH